MYVSNPLYHFDCNTKPPDRPQSIHFYNNALTNTTLCAADPNHQMHESVVYSQTLLDLLFLVALHLVTDGKLGPVPKSHPAFRAPAYLCDIFLRVLE